MAKTNFERVVEGIGNFFRFVDSNSRQEKTKKLPSNSTVVEVSFLSRFDGKTKKDVRAEIEEFFAKASLPFVDIYDSEFFESSVVKQHYVLTTFSVLVAAQPKEAKEEIENRCSKVIETEADILAFRVRIDKNYR